MTEMWLPLKDIPAEGRVFSYDDPGYWTIRWKEYKLPCRMSDPITVTIRVQPQPDGCLITGRLSGSVIMPCDRCAADTQVVLDQSISEYEQLDENDPDAGECRLRATRSGLELDVDTLLWEQFVLALPAKPLCRETCKGLCPECGADLNEGACSCGETALDPRLALLRNLKVGPKQ